MANETINLDSSKRKLDKIAEDAAKLKENVTAAGADLENVLAGLSAGESFSNEFVSLKAISDSLSADDFLSIKKKTEVAKNLLAKSIDFAKTPKDLLSSVDLKQNISTGEVVPTDSKLLVGLDGSIGLADVEAAGEPNEVNVPRLARGIKEGTLYEDQEKHKAFVLSTIKGKVDEPESPYAAQYPYNLVEKSESGHIREVDDTPGAQRLKEMHRAGTFYEIHPDGSKVTKVMRDNFSVTVGEDYTKIEGVCVVHVAGKAELFCQDDVKVETAKDVNLIAAGDVDLTAVGSASITGFGDVSVGSYGFCKVGATAEVEIISGLVNVTGGAEVALQSAALCTIAAPHVKISDALSGDALADLRLEDIRLAAKDAAQDKIIATKKTSDRVLKKDIIRVGASPSGIPTYNFKFIGDITRSVYYGVMAQDLQESHPDAVSKGQDGYLMVDYSLIDVDYQRVS
jgi:hypothetical protein